MTTTKADLTAQGFIEHDGGPMPDCYAPDDKIDIYLGKSKNGPFVRTGDNGVWDIITHHRRHISEREQLDIAIEALGDARTNLLEALASLVSSHAIAAKFPSVMAIDETLKLLRERNPDA